MGKKLKKKNCGSFSSLWLWLLVAIMKRCTEQCALQLYCTSLIHVHSKSKVTENIFNLQEWHQNTKIFISYKTFTDGNKTKTCQEWPNLVNGCLIQVFYKTTTFPKQLVVLYRFDCIWKKSFFSNCCTTEIKLKLAFLFPWFIAQSL